MNDIEQKALALLNEVQTEKKYMLGSLVFRRDRDIFSEALCRAIEQHEAFKQEVSDAVYDYFGEAAVVENRALSRFFIPKPKPDPLVEVMKEAGWSDRDIYNAETSLRAALEARGLEIREKDE
jgi:hypothetical protein